MSRGEACSYIAIPGYRKFSGDSVLIQDSLHDCVIMIIIGSVNMYRCHSHLIIEFDAQL